MIKVPWAEPIERVLRPFEGMIDVGLWGIIVITLLVLWKGDSIGKTAWFVWLATP